jgi:uncharacterized tellurite resistance protein B-like protein
MATLGIIVSVIAFIVFAALRGKRMSDTASNVIDLAASAKGAYSRAKLKGKAQSSVLSGVSDPRTAAATLLYGLAALKGSVTLSDEDRIDAMLEAVCQMPAKERQEAVAFAAWASGEVADPNEIVRQFLPLWLAELAEPQRKQLVDMMLEMAEAVGVPTAAQSATIRRLSEGLFAVR